MRQPWVRWWDRRANAYDALLDAQPALRAGAARVARAALAWRRGAADPSRPLVAVDLAAGAGDCAWALRDLLGRGGARLELVEPGHAMAALARSRAAGRARGAAATVWQIPVERCAERLPARLLGAVDVATCSAALPCINEHDVFEAAAALLKPGGASIPRRYVSYAQPVACAKLWFDARRANTGAPAGPPAVGACVGAPPPDRGLETPFVVRLHNFAPLAAHAECFAFDHPGDAGATNDRDVDLAWDIAVDATVHGLAGTGAGNG